MPVLAYEVDELGLVDWARSVFGLSGPLDQLHLLPDPCRFESYVDRLKYRSAQLRDRAPEIHRSCLHIRNEVLAPVFGPITHFQFPPSFRCHLSGAGTASAFHRDGDPKYGIKAHTLNAWIPLTRVYGNNSIHIESAVDREDYRAVEMEPGNLLVFDGLNLRHGSYPNDTPVSRVSLDIRFGLADRSVALACGVYAQ